MYLLENPVLQRELLINLRMARAFVLLLAYLGILGLVVVLPVLGHATWHLYRRAVV